MAHIKLNKQNFFHNLDLISKKTKSKDKISLVLKDNAYGHGLKEISIMAKEYGIKSAVVKNHNEAKQIKEYFEEILILADNSIHTYSHTFHITVNNLSDIELLKSGTNIHIKIDTGMHRNGISNNELNSAINRAYERNLNIKGIFTHHKSADVLSSEFFWQNLQFSDIKKEVILLCEKLNLPQIKFHCSNSAALFRFKNPSDDMYRIGIAAYGYISNKFPLNIPDLKPVLSLHANKLSTRILLKGQRVGYGGIYEANKDMEISTYNIGYGDGLKRSNMKSIDISDKNKILGRISMDNICVNSTKDEICIFNNVSYQAKIHNTIEYEILTSLNKDIKREIVN